MDISNPFAPVFVGHFLSPRSGARRRGRNGPPHARDLPGPRHRPALSHRRQRRRADGAALHRADPRHASDSRAADDEARSRRGHCSSRLPCWAVAAYALRARHRRSRVRPEARPLRAVGGLPPRRRGRARHARGRAAADPGRRRERGRARPRSRRRRRSRRDPLPSRSRRDPGGGLSRRVRDVLGVRAARHRDDLAGAAAEPDAAGGGGRPRRDHALQHALPAAHDPSARHQPAQQHGRRAAHDAARGAAGQVSSPIASPPGSRARSGITATCRTTIHPLHGARRHADHRAEPAAQSSSRISIPGAGRITSMAKATREEYQNEYSLVYMDIDDRLNRIPAAYTRSARDREAHAPRLRRRRSARPTSFCSTAARSRSRCATRRSW